MKPRTLLAMMAEALPPSRPTRRKPDLLASSPAGEKRLMKYKYPPHRAAMQTSPSICDVRCHWKQMQHGAALVRMQMFNSDSPVLALTALSSAMHGRACSREMLGR